MRRRTFLSALPADPYADVGVDDRITGLKFMGRSTVWGTHGAATEMRKDGIAIAY